MGHYAIHYDHLDKMSPDEDDGWLKFFGNRLATAILLLKVADSGGATIFPRLKLAIQPEIGESNFFLSFPCNSSLILSKKFV